MKQKLLELRAVDKKFDSQAESIAGKKRTISKNDTKIREKVRQELEPFFNDILSLSDEDICDFREDIMKFTDKSNNAIEIYLEFVVDSASAKVLPTSVKEQVFLLYQYLSLVEGVGNCIVDMLIMLLVANGKDFHVNSSGIKHVHSLDELECAYTPLRRKLDFLKYYKIKTFPSSIDCKLRNDIAHLKFRVEKNKVIIQDKEVWDVVLPKTRELIASTQVVRNMFEEFREQRF